ncbi:MAG: hypothetical protein WC804_15160 [Sphingomonas sp.]|uniref:hypothetical protein n=1 Tax=Sphingomonas sp. TaxID=28214 RepID=UPI00356B067D
MIDTPPTMPPAIIKSLAECGLDKKAITVVYDNQLESEVVTIGTDARARTDMFECILTASWGKFDVMFADEALFKSYRALYEAKAQVVIKDQAISWLKAHGKFEGLPIFEPSDDASKFAQKVEKFCGLRPGEAIELISPTMFTFRREFMKFPINPKLECVMNVMFASDLESHGIHMGFIGNEAYGDAPPHRREAPAPSRLRIP